MSSYLPQNVKHNVSVYILLHWNLDLSFYKFVIPQLVRTRFVHLFGIVANKCCNYELILMLELTCQNISVNVEININVIYYLLYNSSC